MTTNQKRLITIFAIIILALLMFFFPISFSNKIARGVYVDGSDLSGLSKQQAENLLNEYRSVLMNETIVSFDIGKQKIDTTFAEYCFDIDFTTSLDKAFSIGRQGNLVKRINDKRMAAANQIFLVSDVTYNEICLDNIVAYLSDQFDVMPIEANVIFTPEEYDFFAENANPQTMFEITQGINGKNISKESLRELIVSALCQKENTTIEVPFNIALPRSSLEELRQCTTFIYHSSSYLNSTKRQNSNRNHNIEKALEKIKGLVVMPGDTISFFGLIGEPLPENGWLLPMADFFNKEYYLSFPELSQPATAIYNAVFRAGAQIIEINHHTYPAYSKDYGYGMDAYVKYGESDLVFKNTSDYPIFFDAYFCYDSIGRPGYVDVDVYTFPIGKNMYIAPISEIVETIPPPPTEYLEVPQESYSYYNWTFDEDLDMYTFQQTAPRDGYIVQTYKAIYENGVQESPGVWTGGELISKEEYERIEYPAQQGLILTKPANIE